ncbi:GGDEF domain-containing protein [Thalassotalea castellviae]|uniref:diguanylate cyclase n=1 Tax=Thalassotalea castellviae TaxID=3075612 RepID=A0ABU3A3U5_9GAMM|nr:GGDEF domain-containing protein [Thalassotalea sp. W431]MDT0604575.1 GGDEF domain-containing protein [Thalassotalea sp. W431]
MQTLNVVESANVEFNAFKLFDIRDHEDNYRKLALTEQLQTSLELKTLLNIFAMEASKFVNFSGLYFKQESMSAAARGSKPGKSERSFELKINNEYIGTLTYALNAPISLTNRRILQELHQLLIHPINNAIKYQNAIKLAMQDGLTGLGNRRYFDEQLHRAMHHANRQRTKVGLMVCDLNKFKQINDTFGHDIGDEILVNFAKALTHSVRDSDSSFRFGGDEFAIIVEDASEQSLIIIEERIKSALSNNSLLAKYQVACALGYTFMSRDDDASSFFKRADNLLYRHKIISNKKLSLI